MSQSTVVLFFVTIGILVLWKIIDVVKKKAQQAEQEQIEQKKSTITPERDVEEEMAESIGSGTVAAEPTAEKVMSQPAPPMSAPGPISMTKHKGVLHPSTVRVIITMILLLAAVYIILSNNYEPDSQKWAFGVVGTILGYWLKTEKS